MKHLIFSPLAVICALSVLYPTPQIKTEKIDWFDSFEEIDDDSEDLFSLLEFDEEESSDLTTSFPSMDQELDQDVMTQTDSIQQFQESEGWEETTASSPIENSLLAASSEEEDDEDDEDSEDEDEEDTNPTPSNEIDVDEDENASVSPQNTAAPNYPRPRSSNAVVNTAPPVTQTQAAPRDVITPFPTSSLGIGASYSYVHFTPTGLDSFHGNLAGAQALFEYRPSSGFYAALKANWREGLTKSSHGASRHLTDVLAEERIGFTAHSKNRLWHLSIFSGLGFHYSNQKLHQPGFSSMRLIYNQFYCPLGFFSDYRFFRWFSVGVTGVWMPQVFPTLTTSPLGGARWKTKLGLQNALVEVPITFYAGGKTQFFFMIKPTFQFWQDGHTTAKTTTGLSLGVPKNTYYFVGTEVNLGCEF